MATIVFDTPNGPVLCSRVNAGSLERGDVALREDGEASYRITNLRKDLDAGHAVISSTRTDTGNPDTVRLRLNTPVWRAVGARAGGILQ